MTKRIAFFLFVAILVGLLTLSAAAQDTVIIRGTCKDENGKPMDGAIVELAQPRQRQQIHRKNQQARPVLLPWATPPETITSVSWAAMAKCASPSITCPPTLPGDRRRLRTGKIKAQSGQPSGMSEEQRKQWRRSQRQRADQKGKRKDQSINALLQQAAQQKNDKQYDAAVATMEQAAAQDQTHDIVYGSLGDAYNLDKKYPEAEAAFTKALALAPATSKSLATYHAGLAMALLEQGKTDASAAECDKTAALDPKQAGLCYYNEGAILTNQGKADDANQAFDKAIAPDPTRADAYYQKGVNLLAKATLDKDSKMVPAPGTAEALNKYLELAPDGKYAQSARDLLASIGASVQTSFGTQKKGKK